MLTMKRFMMSSNHLGEKAGLVARVAYARPIREPLVANAISRSSRQRPDRELRGQQLTTPMLFVGSNLRAPSPPPLVTSTSIMDLSGQRRDSYHDYARKIPADSLSKDMPVNLALGVWRQSNR